MYQKRLNSMKMGAPRGGLTPLDGCVFQGVGSRSGAIFLPDDFTDHLRA